MPQDFSNRLIPILPEVVRRFGTPFHVYDELGILDAGRRLLSAFAGLSGFNNFYSAKANPNPAILQLMQVSGFGFDCSSIPELVLARQIGAGPEEIMFTSNNTSPDEFAAAMDGGGCILNLDDITLVAKVPEPFPELISFRYNPGPLREGLNSVIGEPKRAKYGVAHHQIVEAYRVAMTRGARRFGLHTMVISNERNQLCMVETVRMLLKVVEMISDELGITFEFINMGGGLGIPYKVGEEPIDVEAMALGMTEAIQHFQQKKGYAPRLLMESGRWCTGPYGVLVATCINRKDTYEKFRGLDASCTSTLMRPAIYHPGGGYHHITVCGKDGRLKPTDDSIADFILENESPLMERVNVTGSVCEDSDRFAWDRRLPVIDEGDLVLIHDTGAHAYAMASNYNGRLRPAELLLRGDGRVEMIRRAETVEDILATFEFKPSTFVPSRNGRGRRAGRTVTPKVGVEQSHKRLVVAEN